ncbi:hypothetical protein LT493_30320 [Streptomyces tricolor]|nr:hypothetical protein [Streptomyces tricolor]
MHYAKGRLLAVNQRPTDRAGCPGGTVVTLRDSTELQAVSGRGRGRPGAAGAAVRRGLCIGSTLDVVRTADELARVAVPRFADFVTVDLADRRAAQGRNRERTATDLRRVAVSGIRDDHPL